MPLFAITGITGHVGGAAARRLLARGARVRAVVRKEGESTAAWREQGAESAVAALGDAGTLQRAFDATDGVFVMMPTWFENTDMFAENIRAVEALGQALRAAQPGRIVLLSSIGAQHAAGTGAILKLHHMEQAFADLAGVVSVRAGWFMENYAGLIPSVRATGVLPSMLAPLSRAHPMVATQDIGAVVADLLLDPARGRSVAELEGPRRYAPHEIADAFSKTLGRPVKAQILPPSDWLGTYAEWGLTPRSAEAMSEMLVGFNSGHIDFEGSQAETMHGPTTLEQVLAGLVDRSSLSRPSLEISQ
jgi:NAD(P)H dehydrogenase (quinone)